MQMAEAAAHLWAAAFLCVSAYIIIFRKKCVTNVTFVTKLFNVLIYNKYQCNKKNAVCYKMLQFVTKIADFERFCNICNKV